MIPGSVGGIDPGVPPTIWGGMVERTPDIDRLRDAALSRRSPLYRWLLANHQKFAAVIDKADGLFRWQDIAAGFAAEGLTDTNGKPPSAATAKATWERVTKAIESRKLRKRKQVGHSRPPAAGIVQPVPSSFQTFAPPRRTSYEFKLASLKKHPAEEKP